MKVELLQPHRHGNDLHPIDAVIDVDTDTAMWLFDHGIAKRSTKQKTIKPTPINPTESIDSVTHSTTQED